MIIEEKTIKLWDGLNLTISKKDWDFLCKYRFFSEKPPFDEIRAEFTTGTGITSRKPDLWSHASDAFAEYVEDLRSIMRLDINQMARNLLDDDEKYKVNE